MLILIEYGKLFIIKYKDGDFMIKTKEEIKLFVDACEKMSSSKFIMIDKRISDVLKSIAKTESVFNLIKECMINFNFDLEWRKATVKSGCLTPPDENYKFIAFVFALLNCIDDKKISASDLLSRYFTKVENPAGPYGEFCESIILKFKDVICHMLVPDEKYDEEMLKSQSQQVVDKEICARIVFLAKDLKDYVGGLKKVKKSTLTKGEIVELLNNLINAVKNGHYQYIKSLLIAVKAAKGKDKEIEHRLNGILEIVNSTFIDA